jgi:outer membrane protein assembly factor BamB
MRFVLVLILLLLAGCSSSGKKQYPPLDPIDNTMVIKPLWVKKVGAKSFIESRQFTVGVGKSRVYIADAKGKISALSEESGEIVWTRMLGDLVSGGPTVDGDLVYVSSNEAQLYALNANTGEVVWTSALSSEVLADTAVSDKYVYLQTIDGKLYALSKKTGEKIWVDSREVPALTLRGTSSPLVLNSMIVAGFANGKIAAFEPETGNRLWETAITVPSGRTDLQRIIDIDGSIQADTDQIYAATYQGRIAAISQLNGRTTWSREMSAFNGLKLDGQQIFLTDASDHIWCIDSKTGATIWRQDKLEGRDLTAVSLLPGAVVVADGAGYLHWLSRDDGSFVSRENLLDTYGWAYHDFGDDFRKESDFGVSNELKVANNKLYVRNNMGALSVFQLPVSKNN